MLGGPSQHACRAFAVCCGGWLQADRPGREEEKKMTSAASTAATEGQVGQARRDIAGAAAGLVQANVLSPSQHGNISVRIPGTVVIVLTSVSSLVEVTR